MWGKLVGQFLLDGVERQLAHLVQHDLARAVAGDLAAELAADAAAAAGDQHDLVVQAFADAGFVMK